MDPDQVHQILEKLYLTPQKTSSLGGVERLWNEAKHQIPGLKKKQVQEFLQTQFAYTQHKPYRRKFTKRKVIAVNINDVYHMDLVDMQTFSEFNNGFKYILTVIDCFSRYGMAYPLKSKKPEEVIEGLSKAFKLYGIPLKVFSDNGTEFLAKSVKSFLKELNIQQWNSKNPGKAVMVERFNRTLKERLWVYMTDQNNFEYIDVLDDVVESYNNTIHSATGYAPSQVGQNEIIKILNKDNEKDESNEPLFKVGDYVRVAKTKLTFEKGYETKYSRMLYKISGSRKSGNFNIYSLRDLANRQEPGWFYEKELSKVVIDRHEKHRVDRIVRQRKVQGRLQHLVRWAGYPSNYDSWEWADELQK